MSIKAYIQGQRKGKEANRIEREAMSDPFLQDALDGFDRVAGDHRSIIDQLEKKYTHSSETRPKIRNILFYGSIAASVLLLIGFGTYLLWERNNDQIFTVAMLGDREVSEVSEVIEDKTDNTAERARSAPVSIAVCDSAREGSNPHSIKKTTSVTPDIASPFGEKEFIYFCQQNAKKYCCLNKKASVKLTFLIDENGKPSQIEYKKYSCQEAKNEIKRIIETSPVWTKTNRKVTMTVQW